ncbi:LytR/AlgR family response regulator transcription factor [Marinicella meishanensis]|uniref:LytR/AlgR family response regulator transcription factor n=1 Tax=Marinicella meishanensis TaxID=2873263 RepID=UPI001CC10CD8|nr:response regulator [Marinicella sp. NBU2979]
MKENNDTQPHEGKTIRTMIVDDELLARRGLSLRLDHYADIELVAECANGREALAKIAELSPDLVFLDIQMPGINGFDVVEQMQSDDMPLVVFVTAFDKYAVEAFEVHAVDYVLKPIEDCRLETAINRVRQQMQQSDVNNQKQRLMDLITNITGKDPAQIDQLLQNGHDLSGQYPEKLSIKDSGRTTLIPVKDITWIEAAGDYMCIHSNNPKQVNVLRSTMKELESKLNPALFQRVHRSTMVNIDCIQKICSHINGEYFLILDDESKIKMSRSYRSKIKHII